jgi:hypothetical protein
MPKLKKMVRLEKNERKLNNTRITEHVIRII